MGNGVVTSGVLESSGRVPALAVEGGLGLIEIKRINKSYAITLFNSIKGIS